MNRDQLLKRVVNRIEDTNYTVHDVIDFEAHIMGAAHAGGASTDKERAMLEIANRYLIGGMNPTLRHLLSFGTIVRRGLEPLRVAIGDAAPAQT